jgi:nucleoside 2-deoxyribosyltransferase
VSAPTIYLVGAIRDGRREDIEWRERVIAQLRDKATFLSPLGGKTYDPETKRWSMTGGVVPDARFIYKQDMWCVDRADVIIANMTSLSERYPSIGSLMELGRATARGALIFTILEPGYTGHENQALYTLHPFIDQSSTATFSSVDACIDFLHRQLDVLSGRKPDFDGYAR